MCAGADPAGVSVDKGKDKHVSSAAGQASTRTRFELYRDPSLVELSVPNNHLTPYSPVNISAPDLSRHPRFAEARRVSCRVEAGDAIYVPTEWWHEVESHPDADGKTVGVNLFYRPWFHRFGFVQDAHQPLIRNEHYAHLAGEVWSAMPCPSDPLRVCFVS